MKIIIFGATGSIGKQLVLQALAQGYEVTAFARNREKLGDLAHASLRFVKGDVMDKGSVYNAIKGHEAVFCALGAGRKGSVRSQGTKNIIMAMAEANIIRLICQTTLGCGDSRGNLDFFWKRIMFGWYLREAYADHELQEKYIKESLLDWTIVRPAAFKDGKLTGKFNHGFSANDRSLELKIARADVAFFMLQQLQSDEYLRKTPGLSY